VMGLPYQQTEEGQEMHMATNHLGHFLLTSLLLPQLRRHGAPARVVTVSSIAHLRGRIDLDGMMDVEGKKKAAYNSEEAYSNSKLANILFTRELATRLEGSNVTAYCVHPGVVLTDIARHIMPQPILSVLCPLLMKTPEQGAQTTLHCCLDAQQDASCGHYFSDCGPGWPAATALDDVTAGQLWRRSAQLLKLDTI